MWIRLTEKHYEYIRPACLETVYITRRDHARSEPLWEIELVPEGKPAGGSYVLADTEGRDSLVAALLEYR